MAAKKKKKAKKAPKATAGMTKAQIAQLRKSGQFPIAVLERRMEKLGEIIVTRSN